MCSDTNHQNKQSGKWMLKTGVFLLSLFASNMHINIYRLKNMAWFSIWLKVFWDQLIITMLNKQTLWFALVLFLNNGNHLNDMSTFKSMPPSEIQKVQHLTEIYPVCVRHGLADKVSVCLSERRERAMTGSIWHLGNKWKEQGSVAAS